MPRKGRAGEERIERINLVGKEKEESGTKVPSKKRKSQRLDFASARQCASLEPELNCEEDRAKPEAARPRLCPVALLSPASPLKHVSTAFREH